MGVALLTWAGPAVRAFERYRTRLAGLRRAQPAATAGPSRLGWGRRDLSLSFWNGTGIDKERCIGALVETLRPRHYAIVLDDGWQPWDLVVNHGVWARAEVKLLVQDHGGQRRQLDVGLRVRRTRLARLVAGALVLSAAFSALAGPPGLTAVLAFAALGTEVLVVQQRHRLARMLYQATEDAAGTLPLERLQEGRPV